MASAPARTANGGVGGTGGHGTSSNRGAPEIATVMQEHCRVVAIAIAMSVALTACSSTGPRVGSHRRPDRYGPVHSRPTYHCTDRHRRVVHIIRPPRPGPDRRHRQGPVGIPRTPPPFRDALFIHAVCAVPLDHTRPVLRPPRGHVLPVRRDHRNRWGRGGNSRDPHHHRRPVHRGVDAVVEMEQSRPPEPSRC